ncbi:hypothetical protein M9H77_05571 [Catharanthus roseus]|uniref:Uncharacterized protein n=1 Tax=Catharanthus roseus TaxID=4058 RepID=A0ACC0CHW1_CATRO|nr:hypothetical protein M9H77_05571 [Catharanthus roseus]
MVAAICARSFTISPFDFRRQQRVSEKKLIVCARKDEYRNNLVDENMIVLRRRIKEMKMLEMGQTTPSNWMEWEKKYFVNYNEDVCEAIGLLQMYLMNVSPSLALGIIALVALSVPISTSFVLFNVIEMVKKILL